KGDRFEFTIKLSDGSEGNLLVSNGCLIKRGQQKAPFNRVYFDYTDEIDDLSNTNFDINNLFRQVINECFYDGGDRWSENRDRRNYGNSTSLIMRIRNLLTNNNFKNILGFEKSKPGGLTDAIRKFL